ncbi:hypothetical protein [Haloferula sp. BvORR071]|uniref:hypothetical protein n=1 Tax=Haloferula sp. BvORR071 TaxID=1396141 RepID=UPI000558430B|nr:hypothetical protein [Haloferula sp. BvORR071]
MIPAAALADEVILTEGSRLAGTVTAMADDGRISLASPLSFEPFQLKADSIQRVLFAQAKGASDESDAMMVLSNGDQFPCELQGIADQTVKIHTAFAGDLDIARDRVNTIQLGVRPRKVLYRGPENDSGWTMRSGWRYDSKRFIAEGGGSIARSFETPGSFALRFTVAWKTMPNLQVFFADDLLETTGKADRYLFSYDGSQSFQLKRQQSGDSYPYKDMNSIRRDPSEFPDSKVEVELRVDRKLALVHLYINGEFEGKFSDPLKVSPTGKGVMFLSKIGGDDQMVIDNIEVREWDASSDRHRTENRGDDTRDVMITRSSDRGAGTILGMKEGKEGPVILFQSPHYPDPVEMPVANVSTLFFAKAANAPAPPQLPWMLGLRGRGFLAVSSCSFSGESLLAEHPLLGKLEIRRDAIARLERKALTKEDEEDPGNKPGDGEEDEE